MISVKIDDNRRPPSTEELAKLEENMPTRTYQLSILRPSICFQAADLPEYDVTKKVVISDKKSKKV